MSAGFGWSLSDVALLTRYVSTIHKALKEEGGSAPQYREATSTLSSLRLVLDQIHSGLNAADPGFRNALQAQLDVATSSIACFNTKLQEEYGDRLSNNTPMGRCHGTWPKVKWAFSAAKELGDFWIVLSRQLEIVKLLILSETYAEIREKENALAGIDSKVTENLRTSNATDQHIRSLSSHFQQSRASTEVSLTLTQDLCRSSNLVLHKFQTENNESIRDIAAKVDAFSNNNSHTVATLAVLNHEVSSLNAQIGENSSALLDMQKKEEQKSDTAIGLIQDLHTLMRNLHDDGSGSQQAVQYAGIQNRIDSLRNAVERSNIQSHGCGTEESLLLKSRNGMTRRLIETMDSAGAKLEGRLVVEFLTI